MANAINWFEIPVNDFGRAKKFYSEIFGIEMQEQTMGPYQVGLFPGGGVSGSIIKGDGCVPSKDGVVVYLNGGDDLSGVLDKVEQAGGKITEPKGLVTEEIGYVAFFTDTEGNRVALHSRILPQKRLVGDMKLFLYDLLARGLSVNYILDVGAHFAGWSREAQSVFPNAVFYLIEPLMEMETDLKKFCNEFAGSKYFLKGAGPSEGKFYLTILAESLAGANCMYPENEYFKSNNWQREVEIITIDSLIEDHKINIPDLVKLDIQGFELEALKGATKLFGKTEIFILEISLFEFVSGIPIFSQVVNFMADKGYEAYDFPGFSHRPYDDALGQIDVCFAKKNGFLRKSNSWIKKPIAEER